MRQHIKLIIYALLVINIFINAFFTVMLIFSINEYNIYNILTGIITMTTLLLLAALLEEINK